MSENTMMEKASSFVDKHKVFVGSLVLIVGFTLFGFLTLLLDSLIGIGIMGIGILLTVLIGGNILSKEHELTAGEVRRAIAISFVSVFFGLLAVGESIKTDTSVLTKILENFWWIIITVIGFYFGGRSAEKIVDSITGKWAKGLEDKAGAIEKQVRQPKTRRTRR